MAPPTATSDSTSPGAPALAPLRRPPVNLHSAALFPRGASADFQQSSSAWLADVLDAGPHPLTSGQLWFLSVFPMAPSSMPHLCNAGRLLLLQLHTMVCSAVSGERGAAIVLFFLQDFR
jgi:hypothetical protein